MSCKRMYMSDEVLQVCELPATVSRGRPAYVHGAHAPTNTMCDAGTPPLHAGMAGLSCARHLHRAGVSFCVLEAADGVGGRVRTDALGGFQLDRGFQIFLTSYPEARAALDYAALELRPFYAGAQTGGLVQPASSVGAYQQQRPTGACHAWSLHAWHVPDTSGGCDTLHLEPDSVRMFLVTAL